ncbi:chalcone isomerase family protein [Photobacterium sp. SDRW27]|uniref:chalcone isomerase family protein n=1 Tax=Photobacterium obscurum TaxID=2829490 RepID=UPI002244F053|nr:chalcone isomerase family protein [Photobacterium obscurum]MCW8329361.1 chalcone isomerase family protein [Photobacterium obscurum]
MSWQSSTWQAWRMVGDAQLKWGPWVIYDSELRTPTGYYQDNSDELALVIKYQRDIAREDLLEATGEQWEHLGVPADKRRLWLAHLSQIWPDVKKGDRLIFVIKNGDGVFYQDNTKIGVMKDSEMSNAFLHIWLSPDTSYPHIRRQLIGKT